MFTRPCIYLLACVVLGWLAGCSSPHHAADGSSPSTAAHDKKNDDAAHDMEDPPHVGMTKDEVQTKYGYPLRRTYSEEGEEWLYRLNFRDAALRGLNPFDLSERTMVRYGTVTFNTRGHVKHFHWDAGSAHG